VNHPLAKKPPRRVRTAVAGAAPTAHLIEELERIGIVPVHVYGLTYVLPWTLEYVLTMEPQRSQSSRKRVNPRNKRR
jgi:hypothetical protein